MAAETTEAPDGPLLRDVDLDVTDPTSVLDTLIEAAEALAEGFVARLPLVVLALVLLVVGLLLVKFVVKWTEHGLQRSRIDQAVSHLVVNLLRVMLVVFVLLLALSVAGVQVGAALAGLGLAGLALAFALQNILENFVAGLLILMRRPFRRGDQIETNDYAGVVEDIDLRVTRVRVFDGELVLIPNATVFTEPITNLTQRGHRRSRVVVGIDYRDDHDRARDVLLEAVRGSTASGSSPSARCCASNSATPVSISRSPTGPTPRCDRCAWSVTGCFGPAIRRSRLPA